MKLIILNETIDRRQIRLTKEKKWELDNEWSRLVKKRDKRCKNPTCRSRSRLEAHHIIKRRHIPLRWCLENGITFCYTCHRLIVHGKGKEAVRQQIVLFEYLRLTERIKDLEIRLEALGRAS